MGAFQPLVGDDDDSRSEPGLQLVQFVALFVEQIGRHVQGEVNLDRLGVLLESLVLDEAQQIQGR